MSPPTNFTSILPSTSTVTSHTLLTSLWSNYGHIYRLTLTPTSTPRTLILKLIQPPKTTSTTADESHLRKLLSYRVERYFYTHLSTHLTSLSPVAKTYPVAPASKDEALLLEDLSVTYPHSAGYSVAHAAVVLKWLANFHATYWGIQPESLVAPPLKVQKPDEAEGVWEHGGYWYLDTRREEMDSFSEYSGDYGYLLPYCEYAASKLRLRPGVLGATLMHGDCKAANIVFTPKISGGDVRCALYDFQYVGVGLGVQDLAYFLGTSVDARALEREPGEEGLLRVYYGELVAALGRRGVEVGGYTWEVMMEHWEWALVDWMRFMAGWGCWGNSRWVEKRVKGICRKWEKEGVLE